MLSFATVGQDRHAALRFPRGPCGVWAAGGRPGSPERESEADSYFQP